MWGTSRPWLHIKYYRVVGSSVRFLANVAALGAVPRPSEELPSVFRPRVHYTGTISLKRCTYENLIRRTRPLRVVFKPQGAFEEYF